MDALVGTKQCPHLGYTAKKSLPCCRADDSTRLECGKWAVNPARAKAGASADLTDEAHLCAVLGKDTLPAESLKLTAVEKEKLAKAAKDEKAGARKGYRPPDKITGVPPAKREEADGDSAPVVPTHTIQASGPMPNDKCPCGSGKKYKKCCG